MVAELRKESVSRGRWKVAKRDRTAIFANFLMAVNAMGVYCGVCFTGGDGEENAGREGTS